MIATPRQNKNDLRGQGKRSVKPDCILATSQGTAALTNTPPSAGSAGILACNRASPRPRLDLGKPVENARPSISPTALRELPGRSLADTVSIR